MDVTWFFVLLAIGVTSPMWMPLFLPDGHTRKEKAKQARDYADWLYLVYPHLTSTAAAKIRMETLTARGPNPTAKTRQEMQCCLWIIDGWHRWTGARV
jgi:hypothetical protein